MCVYTCELDEDHVNEGHWVIPYNFFLSQYIFVAFLYSITQHFLC